MKKEFCLFALVLLLVLLSGCASLSPKGKTILLDESEESAENVLPLSADFEVKRVVPVSLDKIDPDGLHPDVKHAMCGWMDNERLQVFSVCTSTLSKDVLPEGAVEQQTERVLTQFATLNYQYGFFEPVLTLADLRADCCGVSEDGKMMACIAGNTLSVYNMTDGKLLTSLNRDILAPRVTFAKGENKVYFTSTGEQKRLEVLNLDTLAARTVLDERSYRVLCGNSENMLLTVVSQGSEEISYFKGGTLYSAVLSGKRSGTACLLPDGSALLVYGDDLYRVTTDGAALLQSGINAFAFDERTGHIAYVQRNADGTNDINIGAYENGIFDRGRLAYKDTGLAVSNLLFNSDLHKLYVQGTNDQSEQKAYVVEFE